MKKRTTIIRTTVLGAFVAALAILNVMPLGAQDPTWQGDIVVTPGGTITAGDLITVANAPGDDSKCLPVDGDEELFIFIAIKKGYTDLYAEAYTYPTPDEEGNWEITVRIPEMSHIPGVEVAGEWHIFADCAVRGPGGWETDYELFWYPIGFFEVVDKPGTVDQGPTAPVTAPKEAKPAASVKAAPSFTG